MRQPETRADIALCPFCSDGGYVFMKHSTCVARWDGFPANPGHVLVTPVRHVESFFDLTAQEAGDAYALLRQVRALVDERHAPDGYTIGINDGRAAGRTIDHLHIHLIPRHHGDVADPRGGVRKAAPNCDPDSWIVSGGRADG